MRLAKGQRPFSSRAASSAADPWQTAAMNFRIAVDLEQDPSHVRVLVQVFDRPVPAGDDDRIVTPPGIDVGEDQRMCDPLGVVGEIGEHAFRHPLAHGCRGSRLRLSMVGANAARAGEVDPEAGPDEGLVEIHELLGPHAAFVERAVGAGPPVRC